MKTHYRFMLLVSGALLLGAGTGFAQDNDGILAPEAGKESNGPGYKGLIPGPVPKEESAPQKQAPAAKADDSDEDQAPAEAAAAPPDQAQPQITYAPGYTPRRIQTVQDIEALASTASVPNFKFDPSALPAGVADKMLAGITPTVKQGLVTPRMRLDGMLPREYTTKQDIDGMMRGISDPNLTGDQRRANAVQAEEKLELLEKSMQAQQDASTWVYAKLNLPAVYISEENESQANSLARVRNAIGVFKQIASTP